MTRTVLFLCSANMYRSRLAEILFNHYAGQSRAPWRARSRALTDTRGLVGISAYASEYLAARGLGELCREPRDPQPVASDEIESADLIIGLCRAEHEPLVNSRFVGLARARAAEDRLRYWNVYDARLRFAWPLRLVAMLGGHPVQTAASGTEHIDFGVRALLCELAARQPAESAR